MYQGFNINLLHNIFFCWLILRHVSVLAICQLQGAFFNMCSLCFNYMLQMPRMIKITLVMVEYCNSYNQRRTKNKFKNNFNLLAPEFYI
jgi:hypothetical protein